MEKFVTTRQATDNRIIWHTHFACRMTKATSYILYRIRSRFFISFPHHCSTVLKLPEYYMQYVLPTIPSLLVVHTRLSYIQRSLFLIQRLQDNEIFLDLSPLHSSTYIQQNSVNWNSNEPDRCRINEYSGLIKQ